jgi:gamma-glutamylcyclotransferase (GGCT)/AIG2-like uncharacterized protein YtfP
VVTIYAAYGTNLNPHQMALRAPASPVFSTGWLLGWRLTFAGAEVGWEGASATVVEDPTDKVFVMLYDVPSQDEEALDAWEGIDLGWWRKLRVRVQAQGGEQLAWLYALDAYEGGLPTFDHLELIATAAEIGGAPAAYVSQLRARPCADSNAGSTDISD